MVRWLVGGDRPSSLIFEVGLFGGAAGADVVVVQERVVAGAEQDEVRERRRATVRVVDHVVGMEFAVGGAARVLAVAACALVERAMLGIGGTASDARVHEIIPCRLDREPAGVARESLGGLAADRAGAFEHRRLVLAEMHDQRRRTAPHTVSAAAGLLGECEERIRSGLLPLEDRAVLLVCGALELGELADGLLECGAALERQLPAEGELAAAIRPRHPQSPAPIQLLVIGDPRRHDPARLARDLAGRLPDRDACDRGVALRRRDRRSRGDLIERQLSLAECLLEDRQRAQRLGRLDDPQRGAVITAVAMRQPGCRRREPGPLRIAAIDRPTYELQDALLVARLTLGDLVQLAPAGLTLPLQRLIDRPFGGTEHMFAYYQVGIAKVCRNCADMRGVSPPVPSKKTRARRQFRAALELPTRLISDERSPPPAVQA